jgi:phenylpyruvate tautomerase PptA (4-oxalocrotonate tautomerase family)
MPLLSIETNVELASELVPDLLQAISSRIATELGKSEAYVMVRFAHNPHMLFGGEDTALAYLQLKSIGLPESSTTSLSAVLCELVSDHLGVAADRTYIEFQDVPRSLWGWNGATF